MNNVISPEAMAQAKRYFPWDEESNISTPGQGQSRFNVEAYLNHYGIPFRTKNNGSKTIYNLDQCLFDSSHIRKDAAIIQHSDGKLGYQCFHDSCKGQTWKKARERISGEDSLSHFCSSPKFVSKQKSPQIVRAVTVQEMLLMEFKPRESILYPWLHTQGLAMVHASRGVGKTMVGIGIAVAVSSGGEFLCWKAPKPSGVLYLDGEMPGGVLQERIAQAIKGSKTEPVAPLRIITPDLQEFGMPDLSSEEGQEAIVPYLEDVSLIIVDNISTLCRTGRENEGESWLPLQEWALRLRSEGYSIIFIHHDGKGGIQRGTSRKEDVLDAVIQLKHPGDYSPDQGARFEVHFKKARMIYGDDVKPFESQLILNSNGTQEWVMKTIEESLTERVSALLNEGIPQHEIAEMLGVTKGTVSKHKTKAANLGMLKK